MSDAEPAVETETLAQVAAFTIGAVYVLRRSGDAQLLRLLCQDVAHRELIFKKIEERWDRAAKNAVAIGVDEALELKQRENLVESPEAFLSEYFYFDDERLRAWTRKKPQAAVEKWLQDRDRDYRAIEPLVVAKDATSDADTNAARVLAFSPRYVKETVAARARELEVSEQYIRRLLHKFAWFGMNKNAMLSLDSSKGKSGPLVRKYRLRPGPKTAQEKIFPKRTLRNARSQRDLAIFVAALETWWVGAHMSLDSTYTNMVKTYYVQRNQHGEFALGSEKIPTLDQFKYSARILIRSLGLKAKREGPANAEGLSPARGRDTDIAMRVGQVFDIDGTPFGRQLVCRFRTVEGKALNVGAPTVLLVFDRVSKKGVGWHVYLGNENWREGYRLALLCAMTSKRERLEWLGLESYCDAWPDDECLRCEFLYIDGGAAASKLGETAVRHMNMDFFLAPPGTPYWKPSVEGAIGRAQRKQSKLAGGFQEANNSVEKEVKRKAKLHADDTVWEFERQLVLDLIEYNEKIRLELATPEAMKRAGVVPSPNAVFRAGVMADAGLARRRLDPAEVWLSLAERKENVEVTVDGIRFAKARYTSGSLHKYWHVLGRVGNRGRTFSIDILYDPLRPRVLYWLTPDGYLDALTRTSGGDADYGTASYYDIDSYSEQVSALAQVQTQAKPKKWVTQRQQGIVDGLVGGKQKNVRTAPSKHEKTVRVIEAANELANRTYDQPERFLAGRMAPARRADVSSNDERASAEEPSTEAETTADAAPASEPPDVEPRQDRRPTPSPTPSPTRAKPGTVSTMDIYRRLGLDEDDDR